MDDLDGLYFDLRGAPENMFRDPAAPAAETADPAPAAETGEAVRTETPAPIADPDEDFTVEQVQDKLREEWGSDFDQRYEDASEAVTQFFKNDPEGLEWFARRIGNHPQAVKYALRLAAIYHGNGLPQDSTGPSTTDIDNALKDFEPGGKHFDAWLGGDRKLNEQRIELYRRRHPGKITIS
jgi:hypothetical protein